MLSTETETTDRQVTDCGIFRLFLVVFLEIEFSQFASTWPTWMLMRIRSFAGCRRVIVRRHHFTLFTALATTQITYATCIRWKYKALHFDNQNLHTTALTNPCRRILFPTRDHTPCHLPPYNWASSYRTLIRKEQQQHPSYPFRWYPEVLCNDWNSHKQLDFIKN